MKPSVYSTRYDNLRAWLRAQREAKGLTLRAVAEKLGQHHSKVGKLEQNRRRIDIVEFVEYCEILEIDPHEGLDVLLSPSAKSLPGR